MALDKILQALSAEAAQQIDEIERAAQAEADQLHTQAQAQARRVRHQQLAAIQAPLQAERARIVNQAKREALQLVTGTRESLIEAVVEEAARRLTAFTATPAYYGSDDADGVLPRLTREAFDRLGRAGQLRIQVRGQDVECMTRLVYKMHSQMGLQASVTGDLQDGNGPGVGGVIVTSTDGRIRLDNTLAGRLQRVARLARAHIAMLLCGKGQKD